jgi:hypothetical protein
LCPLQYQWRWSKIYLLDSIGWEMLHSLSNNFLHHLLMFTVTAVHTTMHSTFICRSRTRVEMPGQSWQDQWILGQSVCHFDCLCQAPQLYHLDLDRWSLRNGNVCVRRGILPPQITPINNTVP